VKNNIIKNAVLNASLTALYIIAISLVLFYVPKTFEPDKAGTVFIPIIMLSLLVFSAALTGSLVFGRPIIWYLDGNKKEAISLLAYTLGIFLIITFAVFFLLFILY